MFLHGYVSCKKRLEKLSASIRFTSRFLRESLRDGSLVQLLGYYELLD